MQISLTPVRQLFYDWENDFRVLACKPNGWYADLSLSKYGTFTLSGTNLTSFDLDETYDLVIREDTKSRYPNSYTLVGLQGVEVDTDLSTLTISPSAEFQILSRFMTKDQAKHCLDAYPDFVERILRDEADSIDVSTIKNVGNIRLESYIEKIRDDCKYILLTPICSQWHISAEHDISALVNFFTVPSDLENALNTAPYALFIDRLGWSFQRADETIMEVAPQWADSVHRCEYACVDILKRNEEEGDTRINANAMAQVIKAEASECLPKIVEAVTNSEVIAYDAETKYAALKGTFKAEQTIAKAILTRINHPEPTVMDWEPYVSVDGLTLTEEQTQILQLACEKSVMMLTGNAGSGKSQSLVALIRMLEANGCTYTLLAPTGVAAKRLREATGRYASTIHLNLARNDEINDYLIIDEASMIGVSLLSGLLLKTPKATKIIFVCDEAQLASISCGNVVQDLLNYEPMPRARLTKVFRYGVGGISTIATDIRNGSSGSIDGEYADYHFVSTNNSLSQIIDEYNNLRLSYQKQDILILCPYNKTKVGTYAINALIQKAYNGEPTGISYQRDRTTISFNVGDRVINTHNSYRMEVYEDFPVGTLEDKPSKPRTVPVMNGDIGTIRDFVNEDTEKMLVVEFDNTLVKFEGKAITQLLLGYAVSIHRTQGTQAKAVIVVVGQEHARLLSRNLLYVGVSRAQEELVVISDKETIEEGLGKCENNSRDTWLKDLLEKGMETEGEETENGDNFLYNRLPEMQCFGEEIESQTNWLFGMY